MKRVQTRLNFENDTIHAKKKNEMQCTASGHYYISVSLVFNKEWHSPQEKIKLTLMCCDPSGHE